MLTGAYTRMEMQRRGVAKTGLGQGVQAGALSLLGSKSPL